MMSVNGCGVRFSRAIGNMKTIPALIPILALVTEVCQIVSGSGAFVTGGAVEGGVSQHVGPGDMVIIPPNTPHWFSKIDTDQVVYTVARIDPRKILPAGYDASKRK